MDNLSMFRAPLADNMAGLLTSAITTIVRLTKILGCLRELCVVLGILGFDVISMLVLIYRSRLSCELILTHRCSGRNLIIFPRVMETFHSILCMHAV